MQALRCAFYSFRSGTKKSISDGLSRESEQRRKDNAHLSESLTSVLPERERTSRMMSVQSAKLRAFKLAFEL